ncbi:two-component sensor histidine kinase [Heliomicrobium modesticaldum Ice1]|uniref:histidine kinase n=1 Tax=Heliobacterium modesticaldum (strain ATCC 51547 / Ice1) TaxID=498761 RepID=B0TE43_HELMI|nr:MASE3 domain-containing protein [Heliomicrobium modesticaldum]ABZ84238.1 two-component sensor histidine kinase [Heliomicrobium modesticaldum Ice1]
MNAGFVLPLHIIIEGAGIVVSMFVFSTIWHTREKASSWLVFVGSSFWVVGMLDSLHILTYPGMVASALANVQLCVLFECLSRLLLAGAMLTTLLISPVKRVSLRKSLFIFLSAVALFLAIVASLFAYVLPNPQLLNEQDLAWLRNAVMATVFAFNLLGAWLYWQRGKEQKSDQGRLIAGGLALGALSAGAFFLEASVSLSFYVITHLLKVLSYGFFYQAIFIYQVKIPFEELARRRSAHRARMVALMNASKDGIAFYTSKHGEWVCNASFGELFGIDEEVLHFDDTDLFYRAIQDKLEEPEKVAAILQQDLQRDVVERLGPWRVSVLSEPARSVDLYLNPVEVKREVLGWLLIFRDVTKETEFHRLRSEYFSAATHEIRTPLASIDGYIDMALEPGVAAEEQRHYLNQAKANLSRLHQLVSNILDLEKLQASLPGHRFQLLAVETLLTPIADNYAILAAKKGLQFRCDIAPGLPLLYGDEIRLGQALSNLLSNAVKYTLAGSCGIQASLKEDKIRIDVWDTGIGLSELEMRHLFERFYRAENEVTRKTTGTGLGLSIVKTIIESHGGEIAVSSHLGRGTTFTILLPIVDVSQIEPAAL